MTNDELAVRVNRLIIANYKTVGALIACFGAVSRVGVASSISASDRQAIQEAAKEISLKIDEALKAMSEV